MILFFIAQDFYLVNITWEIYIFSYEMHLFDFDLTYNTNFGDDKL